MQWIENKEIAHDASLLGGAKKHLGERDPSDRFLIAINATLEVTEIVLPAGELNNNHSVFCC